VGGPNYTPEIHKLIRQAGCRHIRTKKHEIWENPATGLRFSVPIACKSRHTANAILKSAGVEGFRF
jgi:hypothetical protein